MTRLQKNQLSSCLISFLLLIGVLTAQKDCLIPDFQHFQRIRINHISPSMEKVQTVLFNETEIYLSFCQPLPDSILEFCKIGEDFNRYFYIEIRDGNCEGRRTTDILGIDYNLLNENNIKINQMSLKFRSLGREIGISFPSAQMLGSPQISNTKKSLLLDLPPGISMEKADGKFFEIENGYFWSSPFSRPWVAFVILKITAIIITLTTTKMGQRVFKRIRPFDFAVNFYIYYFLLDMIIQGNEIYQKEYTSLLVTLIPFMIATFVNAKIPTITERLTICIILTN